MTSDGDVREGGAILMDGRALAQTMVADLAQKVRALAESGGGRPRSR
jgi:hypothetical protein